MNIMFISGIIFLGIALTLIILLLLVIAQTGFARLESIVGIERDGFPVGTVIPPWSLPDLTGQIRKTPAGDRWQFLIFIHYGLVGFPGLIAGMHDLVATFDELEVIVLPNTNKDTCEATVRGLDLRVPVVPVTSDFYDRYRVRVMPFAFFLNPDGVVQWAGLVNTRELLFHIWHLSHVMEVKESVSRGMR
jgi:hypothetical protein